MPVCALLGSIYETEDVGFESHAAPQLLFQRLPAGRIDRFSIGQDVETAIDAVWKSGANRYRDDEQLTGDIDGVSVDDVCSDGLTI